MVYSSKKDGWIIALVILALALSLLVGLYFTFFSGERDLGQRWLTAFAVAGGLIAIFTFPLRYTITETELLVRSGVTRWRIPLETIEEISPVRDLSSSPAWSINRLAICYMKTGRPKFIYISPTNQAEFLQELAAKAPHLHQLDNRLTRAADALRQTQPQSPWLHSQ